MAQAQIAGGGLWIPAPTRSAGTGLALATMGVIDATGEKVAFTGRYWTPTRGSKSIRKIHFAFGSVTKAGGSALTVSLQDVQKASGNLFVPDETQDQTVAIANADGGFVSNAWYTTGNLSADRSVAYGEELSVVFEYDGGGRLGADTVVISGLTSISSDFVHPSSTLKTGGSFAAIALHPNVIFENSDGTFGTLMGSFPLSAIGTTAYALNTGGGDEYALRFQVPFPCKIDGAWATLANATTSDFDVVLYEGTTALQTVAVDANTTTGGGSTRAYMFAIPETSLSTGTTYYLAIKAKTNSANVTISYFDVSANGHLACHAGGIEWYLASRVDSGSWSTTTTRRPQIGLSLSSFDDGAGGSGGLLLGANKRGGMQ